MTSFYLSLVAPILYFAIFEFLTSTQNVKFYIHLIICMKIRLSEVVLGMIIFCFLLLPSRVGRTQALSSEYYNLAKLILQDVFPII